MGVPTMSSDAKMILGQILALILFSGGGVAFFFFSEHIQKIQIRILDIQGTPPGDCQREYAQSDRALFMIEAVGVLFFAGFAIVSLLIAKNDF